MKCKQRSGRVLFNARHPHLTRGDTSFIQHVFFPSGKIWRLSIYRLYLGLTVDSLGKRRSSIDDLRPPVPKQRGGTPENVERKIGRRPSSPRSIPLPRERQSAPISPEALPVIKKKTGAPIQRKSTVSIRTASSDFTESSEETDKEQSQKRGQPKLVIIVEVSSGKQTD